MAYSPITVVCEAQSRGLDFGGSPRNSLGKVTVHGFISIRALTQKKVSTEEMAVSKVVSRLQYQQDSLPNVNRKKWLVSLLWNWILEKVILCHFIIFINS